MKLVKILSLTGVTAAIGMAFVGTSSAFGNAETIVLCKSAELVCENPWPNPTTLTGHNVTFPLALTSLGTIECEKSSAEVTLLNQLEKKPVGHILSFSLEGHCHLGSTECTVTVIELGGASAVHGPNPLEAIVTAEPLILEGKTSMHTNGTIKCGSFVNCNYTFDGIQVTVTSNEAGELTLKANETPMTGKGFLCPSTIKIDATYAAAGTGMYIES